MLLLLPALLWRHPQLRRGRKSRLPPAGWWAARLRRLPALWVCLRQMGPCIHLLAPCLPTVRRSQVCGGADAALPDRASPHGLCFRRLRLRAGLIGARLLAFVCHKLKKDFFFFAFLRKLSPAPWRSRSQEPRAVRTGRSVRRGCAQQQRDYCWFHPGRPLIRLLGLIFAEWLLILDLKFHFQNCNCSKVRFDSNLLSHHLFVFGHELISL